MAERQKKGGQFVPVPPLSRPPATDYAACRDAGWDGAVLAGVDQRLTARWRTRCAGMTEYLQVNDHDG